MTKLVKTDREIVPAASLAGKVEEALADEGKLAQTVGAHSKCLCQHLREDHAWTGDEKCLINGCACPRFQMRLPRTDLLALAKSLRKCTHPDHIDGRKCGLMLVPCHVDCSCCKPVDIDAVGPGIALTVEPLNPVLRAEGSREITVDTETDLCICGFSQQDPECPVHGRGSVDRVKTAVAKRDASRDRMIESIGEQAAGRMFRPGVPAGEMTATFESAKIITGKDGRPQLAVEMKVEGTGQKLTSMMPVSEANKRNALWKFTDLFADALGESSGDEDDE